MGISRTFPESSSELSTGPTSKQHGQHGIVPETTRESGWCERASLLPTAHMPVSFISDMDGSTSPSFPFAALFSPHLPAASRLSPLLTCKTAHRRFCELTGSEDVDVGFPAYHAGNSPLPIIKENEPARQLVDVPPEPDCSASPTWRVLMTGGPC